MSHPILVTGSHRSGTTWVGRMLASSGEAAYIHEPFNPDRKPGWGAGRIPYWYLYVTRANESFYLPVMHDVMALRYPLRPNLREVTGVRRAALLASDLGRNVVARARGLRPLMKDPLALFSAEWLAQRFDMRVVVMIRHPAAFVSSIERLGWRFRFRGWLAQGSLLRDWLHPFEAEMHRCWLGDVDLVDQGIVMWNAMHHVIREYRRRHPSWIFLRHEDLAAAPQEGFERLFAEFGLRWDARVAARVKSYSSGGNPVDVARWRHSSLRRDSVATVGAWRRRLSTEDIARVRAGVADIAPEFYGDDAWGAATSS
jgi:Sulfotransferase family